MNAYLFGEIYSIHPIQAGRLALFLKNPENNIIGSVIKGTIADTDLASKITLPINSPSEDPQNPIKTVIKT